MRTRLAPSAARTAISRRRSEARARSRLARFAQTMRSTTPVAANSSQSMPLTPPTTLWRNGAIATTASRG